MSNRTGLLAVLSLVSLFLGACAQGPVRGFNPGDQIAFYDFSEPNTFEEGAYTNATLRIQDGVYHIRLSEGDNELWWGQWGDSLTNVVIDVDINQLSELNENAYGVMCRVRGSVGQEIPVDPTLAAIASEDEHTPEATEAATIEATDAEATSVSPGDEATEVATEEAETTETSTDETETAATEVETEAADEATEAAATEEASAEAIETATEEIEPTLALGASQSSGVQVSNGDGYLFLIQGSGSYAIMRARNRALTPLVNWTASSAVRVGPGRNHIRAVCVGDYLAMYVNDVFVADATDDSFAGGQVGLAASAANRLGVDIEFDNLEVRVAQAK